MTGRADEPGAHPRAHRGPADSAGVPWAGRTLTAAPFAGDDGRAPAHLAAALERWAAQPWTATPDPVRAGGERLEAEAAVIAALATSRLLVAVVAVLGSADGGADGGAGGGADGGADGGAGGVDVRVIGDKEADMALVTVTAPDGRRAVPAFTSTAALTAWDAGARPVPAAAARVCLSAVAEGCQAVVLDLAGPVPFEVRQARVWAIGQARPWVPPARDPQVREAVTAALASVPEVARVALSDGVRGDLRVEVALPAGLTQDRLESVLGAVQEALAQAPVVAERVDDLELAVVTG